MKIMIVTPYYFPKIGGLENYAHQLGLSMREAGNTEIVVVTSNHLGRRTTRETINGTTVYRLGTWFKLSNTPLNPLWPVMIRRLINRERPDVVHAHTPVPSLADAAALAAGRTPFVVTYHAATILQHGHPGFNTVARAYKLYERLTLHKAVKIIAVSDYVKEQLGSAYADKTVVVPNAIWNHEIKTRMQPDAPSLIFIGSLDRTHAWKGLADIIEAVTCYKQRYGDDIHLVVVGDGDYRAHYEAMVKTQGLSSNITFAGAKTGAAKDKLLRASTALVCYPTTSNDAFPTVFLEAWAKAVPVIAARIGSISSLIEDGVDGVLVEPRNPAALAEVLHRVMSSKPSRSKMARTALKRTQDNYTWEQQGRTMTKLLEQVR